MINQGQKPFGIKTLNDKQFIKELIKKLVEESTEMLAAKNLEELKEELSDVIEITNYLKTSLHLSEKDFRVLLKRKRDEKGGFNKRFYIGRVVTKDDDRWAKYYSSDPNRFPETKK